MDTTIAALFDLDGVIIDTEPQYSIFWDKTGAEYLHDTDHFGMKSKAIPCARFSIFFLPDMKIGNNK